MAYIIKSFHSPSDGGPRRVFFWQTPWIIKDKEFDAWKEVGGWVTFSGHATQYESAEDAERVNLFRALGGRVDEMRAAV